MLQSSIPCRNEYSATLQHNGSHEMGAFLSCAQFITRNHSLSYTKEMLCKVTALLHAGVVRCSELVLGEAFLALLVFGTQILRSEGLSLNFNSHFQLSLNLSMLVEVS